MLLDARIAAAPDARSDRLAALCQELAVRLTERPSVTGTEGEASFGPWLEDFLRTAGHWGPAPEVWTIPAGPGDARRCVAMLVRRSGPGTVLLTGHYDTVTAADYGELAPLASRPFDLLPALVARVAQAPLGTAEARARDDLASGRFLPGRGLLDMKAGLAAGLAAMTAFCEDPHATGNLLFIAVPDEENASAGARAGAAALGALARERGLEVRAAINLDSISDDGDGTAGRVVALGTVGKVLPWALVVGAGVHSGFPLQGLNAAVLAGALAQRLEWAPELTDESAAEPGTPVSLLSLKDTKGGYDVTTPGAAFATWSVLNHRRDPSTVLDAVERLAQEALDGCLALMRGRAARSGQESGLVSWLPSIPVLRYGRVLAEVESVLPGTRAAFDAHARRMLDGGASAPDVAQALSLMLWERSGLPGPAVMVGLGSVPYLATHLDDARLRAAVGGLVAEAPARHGVSLRAVEYFAGISDMSFWGQGDAGAFARLAPDTPGWDAVAGLHAGSLAQVPCVNLGPWGRDYHRPWERIEAEHGFRALPRLIHDLASRVLAD